MARRCLACSSERAGEIDKRLGAAGRPPLAHLAAEFRLSPDAMERHAARHMARDAADTAVNAPAQVSAAQGEPLAAVDAGEQRGHDHVQPCRRRVDRRLRAARSAVPADAKVRFLASYAATGNLSQSAAVAGVGRRTVFVWQEHDEQFARAFHEAETEAVEALEAEARERATTGSKLVREVYRGDRLVERIIEYRPSDSVLVKLLQALRPEKYRDRSEVSMTQPIVKVVAGFDPADVL